jgi:uncharacterized protein YkwD
MKLAIIALLLFIMLPWQLVAPVVERAVIVAPQEEAEKEVAEPAVTEPQPQEQEPTETVQVQPITVVNPAPPQQDAEPVEYTEEYIAELELAIHDRINAERVRQGLKILGYDDTLAYVSALHSVDMAKENYFAHEDENGCTSSCRVTNAGYEWRAVGENLFLIKSSFRYSVEDASAIIVQGWMGSEGHRRNIVNKDFTEQGIGVVILGNAIYATEVLARPR